MTWKLDIRVDPLGYDQLSDEAQQWRKTLYKDFGLKRFSRAWVTLVADSVILPHFLERLRNLVDNGNAEVGKADFEEILTLEEHQSCDWFTLATPDVDDVRLDGPYPRFSSKGLPSNVHLVEGQIVSAHFKEVVERRKLTGLVFLRLQEASRHRKIAQPPGPWYLAVAQRPLGHGLDHSWYDRERVRAALAKLAELDQFSVEDVKEMDFDQQSAWFEQRAPYKFDVASDAMYQTGEISFDGRAFRSKVSTGSTELDVILDMCPRSSDLHCSSERRLFLRTPAPAEDFTYLWTGSKSLEQDDSPSRDREICFNQRACRVLIEEHIIAAEDLLGITLVDNPPAGIADLDTGVGCPPPTLTTGELERLRLKEAKLPPVLPIDQPASGTQTVDPDKTLKLLRKAKRARPDDFGPGLPRKAVDELASRLPLPLPASWRRVLTVSASGDFGSEEIFCEVQPPREQPAFHDSCVANDYEDSSTPPADRLYFAHSEIGDLYAFVITKEADDAPVILVDHETGQVARQWPGVANFLQSMLTGE